MINRMFNEIIINITLATDYRGERKLRHCKATVFHRSPYHGQGVQYLMSYSTYVGVKLGNIYFIDDTMCSTTTWRHVNKWIADTKEQGRGAVIVYTANRRSDKTYIRFLYDRKNISFTLKDIHNHSIIADTDYVLNAVKNNAYYHNYISVLMDNLHLIKWGRDLTVSDRQAELYKIVAWYKLS